MFRSYLQMMIPHRFVQQFKCVGRMADASLRKAVTLEKAAREDVESFWSEGSLLFRDALVGAGERDGDRRAAAQALAHGVGKKTLLELRELLEQLRGACAFHVGSGHLAGWLSAESWRLLSGGGQDPVI